MATAVSLRADATAEQLAAAGAADYAVLVQDGQIVGVIGMEWVAEHGQNIHDASSIGSVAKRNFVSVSTETTIFDLIASMQRGRAELAVVLSPEAGRGDVDRIRGVVTRSHILEVLAEGMEIFED
jgi:predicted transcriptional regulator